MMKQKDISLVSGHRCATEFCVKLRKSSEETLEML
jgi:hypothetical protein